MRMRLALMMTVFLLLGLPGAAQDSVFPIEPGSVEGSINDSFFSQRYSFQAQTGQTVVIRMETTSGNLDPLLFLFDAAEQYITDNDDFEEGNRDAQITFEPPADGTYIVEATRFQQESGTSSGTYRLTLEFPEDPGTQPEQDPLSVSPQFGVDYEFLEFEAFGIGSLDEETDRRYFALGGRQGQFVRMVLTRTEGDVIPLLNILDENFTVISRVAESRENERVVYAVLPETGWYLVEVTRQEGSGAFSLYTTLVSDTVLTQEEPIEAAFDPSTQSLSYVFNATINERVFINLTVLEGEGIVPELSIIDLGQVTLEQRQSQGVQTRVTLTVPRSGPYIVQARNLGEGGAGRIRLQLRRIEADISKLRIEEASYNEEYKGSISEDSPIDYYRFSGKAGELVTIEMSPLEAEENALDPYIILADSELNELAFNDNVGASRSARVAQFSLPADGDYFILATRTGLSRGTTEGDYEMALTVGQIALQSGALTATLEWEGDADLNLFVRTPGGRTVSWANPQVPSGGTLQIDSNTGCETPTAQPVEHIYWPAALETGDYTVWVWYQNVCSQRAPVDFTLTIEVNGTLLFSSESRAQPTRLQPGERFETSLRLRGDGTSVLVNRGSTGSPSPQQVASQGGDTLIVYGQTLVGTITDEVFAQFYQFQGSAGDTVLITVERITGDLDPIVVLRDAVDNNLAQNDDSEDAYGGDNRNSRLTFTLPEDGRYVIAVTRFGLRDGLTTGDYRLTLTRQEARSQ